MSAIAGLIRFDGDVVQDHDLDPALDAMEFYGADGRATWAAPSIILGHVARHIAPEDGAITEPFSHTHVTITADVRLDNREELFRILDFGQTDRSRVTDTQLIVFAYLRWGQACSEHLIGDYAFALWDAQEQMLFCSRDHVGAKPFYYHEQAGVFAFASDINGLLSLPSISTEIDECQVVRYVVASIYLNQISSTDTFYKRIRKLPFAHNLIVSRSGMRLWRYWYPENVLPVRYKTLNEYADALYEQVSVAVASRIRTDTMIGAHVSGGIDSSSLAVIAARQLRPRPLHAFSWSPPPGTDANETEHARIEAICRQEGLTVNYAELTEKDSRRFIDRDVSREPTDSVRTESVIQARAHRLGVRRIISGYGGDETVSFYSQGFAAEDFISGRWLTLARRVKLRSALGKMVRQRDLAPLRDVLDAVLRTVLHPFLPDRAFNALHHSNLYAGESYVQPELLQRCNVDLKLTGSVIRPLTSVRRTQLQTYYHDHLSNRMGDWCAAGAKHDLDYVYPLTDRRVMEFAYGIPASLFSSWSCGFTKEGEKTRFLYRYAMDRVLPAGIAWDKVKHEPALMRRSVDLTPYGESALRELASIWRKNPWVRFDVIEGHLDQFTREGIPLEGYEFMAYGRALFALILWFRHNDKSASPP